MPVLFQNFRANHYSRRHTVYSKIKRVTNNGYDTSNDFFGNNFTGNISGVNDNSKDFFSSGCYDIIFFDGKLVACGNNATEDNRSNLSTFLYSTDNGVSWTFGNGTFQTYPNVGSVGLKFIISDNTTLYCMGYINTLMKTTDGINWSVVTSIPNNIYTPESMASNGEGDILITGNENNQSATAVLAISIDDAGSFQTMQNVPNTASTMQVFYTQDFFYLYVTYYDAPTDATTYRMFTFNIETTQNINDIYDFNNWDDITANFTDSSNNPNWTGGSSINIYYLNNKTFINMTRYSLNINALYCSTNGEDFQQVTGISENAQLNQIRYNSTNSTYYACANSVSISASFDYFMYSSSDGTSWTGIISTTNFSADYGLTVPVTGFDDFIVDTNGFKLFISYTTDEGDTIYTAGFINTNLTGNILPGGSTILENMFISKIFSHNNYILVPFGNGGYSNANNTIYYQGPNDNGLKPTEHQDDTN